MKKDAPLRKAPLVVVQTISVNPVAYFAALRSCASLMTTSATFFGHGR